MRWTLRFALPALVIAATLSIVLYIKSSQYINQYNAPAYAWASLQNTFRGSRLDNPPPLAGKVEDKVVIMARIETEDTDWVALNLPESVSRHCLFTYLLILLCTDGMHSWQRAIYTVNPSSISNGTLTTPKNKGHEAMAYLTYIIDHYHALPSTMAFVHPHRKGFSEAWHTDTPLHDNVNSLYSLRIPFVQKSGYVNLRCNWNPGCKKAHRDNKHITPEVWQELFAGASKSTFSSSNHTTPFQPGQVGAACCAQFAVSKTRVLERPLSDYQHFRQWIYDTGKNDAQSGRVLEFLWHVIFGMDAV